MSEDNIIKCFECDSTEHIHKHHVIPKSLGGKKTIPLCEICHGLVHERNFVKQRRLSLEGIARAKERGIYKGRKPLDSEIIKTAQKLIFDGMTNAAAAKKVGIGESTLYKYLAMSRPKQLNFEL